MAHFGQVVKLVSAGTPSSEANDTALPVIFCVLCEFQIRLRRLIELINDAYVLGLGERNPGVRASQSGPGQ